MMKHIVSVLTLFFCLAFSVTSASAGKICQAASITATGKPNKFKQIAEANSFLKWKSIAKQRHGGAFNKWSLAEGHNKGCEKLLAGAAKGKWQCFRTGIACREAKSGESASKPTPATTVKAAPIKKKRVKVVAKPVVKKKRTTASKKVRVRKRVAKKRPAKARVRKRVKRKSVKKRVARSKITKRKKTIRKKRRAVKRVRACRTGAVNAYGVARKSARNARASARRNWGLVVKRKYGARWAHLSRAKGGSIGCVPKLGGTQCAVYAVPCR